LSSNNLLSVLQSRQIVFFFTPNPISDLEEDFFSLFL
jgi:hypothetical protein